MSRSFIDKCISGDALLDEIDDYIDVWHDDSAPEDIELHDYLGMTWQEYSLWVADPNILGLIVDARKRRQPLESALTEKITLLAARASSNEEAQCIMKWLQRSGKLNET